MSTKTVYVCDACGLQSDEALRFSLFSGLEDVCAPCGTRINDARELATEREVASIRADAANADLKRAHGELRAAASALAARGSQEVGDQ